MITILRNWIKSENVSKHISLLLVWNYHFFVKKINTPHYFGGITYKMIKIGIITSKNWQVNLN